MNPSIADEEWFIIESLLPEDWEEKARQYGALTRAREVKDARTLLRLILLHTAGGLSLRQTVARASVNGLATISDVALLKRLRSCEGWLRYMNQQIAKERLKSSQKWSSLCGRVLRVVDATTVEEPGATGTNWRVHFCLRLPTLECDFFEVTDAQGYETLLRLPVSKGELILADRGYSTRVGAAHVIESGADLILRLNYVAFPLLDKNGEKLDILETLCKLKGYEPGQWEVQFEWEGKRYSGRLCGIRKSRVATERSRKKIVRKARLQGKTVQAETLALAEYFYVFTTLPEHQYPTPAVLELYRCRWQIELVFKRLKSLLGIGHLPKYDPVSCRAWLQAKLLCALLIERLMYKAKFFSPWGYVLLQQ